MEKEEEEDNVADEGAKRVKAKEETGEGRAKTEEAGRGEKREEGKGKDGESAEAE